MRILHLASSHRWTGAAEPAFGLAREQLRMGHEVHFACAEGASFARIVKESELTWIPGLDLRPGTRMFSIFLDLRKLRRIIRENSYDVIHCHLQHAHWLAALALNGPPGGRIAKDKKPLLIRTFHRNVEPRTDPLHRWLYRKATDLSIVVTQAARDRDIKLLKLRPNQIVWIRGAVDIERFNPNVDPATNRKLWSIPEHAPVAGMVAEMQPHRGHLTFLDTLGEVNHRVRHARYLLVGEGELKKQIRARISAHPLKKQIINAGYRKDDLPETYAAMDVAVILAQGSDGTCRAMLEAMACGKPVIGANVGAIAETIESGKTGWLIDPTKPKELIDALVEALGDVEGAKRMGADARRRIEMDFTQRRRAESVLAAYDQAKDGAKGQKA